MERCVTREIVYDVWRVKILLEEFLDIFIKTKCLFKSLQPSFFRIHNSVRRGCKLFKVRNEALQITVKTPVAEAGMCSNLRR
jgi:hypothetical protein